MPILSSQDDVLLLCPLREDAMLGRLRKKRAMKQAPRPSQRYVFGHGLLPGLFFSDPVRFMATLRSEKELMLRFIWKRAGDRAGISDQAAGCQLACELLTIQNDVDVGLITCPAPQTMPDPFFVAAAYRPGKDAEPQKKPLTRWITLEYGLDTEEDGAAWLCEWTESRVHANCGPLAETTPEAFLEAVSVMVGHEGDLRSLRPPDYVKRVEERQRESGEAQPTRQR